MAVENVNGAGAEGGQQPASGDQSQQQQQQQTPSGSGQQPVAGAGGGSGDNKTYSFKEDRSDWIPRQRLNEQGQKLTAAETRAVKAEQERDSERARVRALAGVDPQDPAAAQTEEIRTAIQAMFPQLKALESLTPEQLQEVMDAAQSARTTARATWERHSAGMLANLHEDVADQLGVEKLTPTQGARLEAAYREDALASVQARQAALQRGERRSLETLPTDQDFLARHERGDKALIAEFAKAYLEDWFTPAKRQVSAGAVQRNSRPVPRGERTRQAVTQGPPSIDYNDKTAFKAAMIAARNASQ